MEFDSQAQTLVRDILAYVLDGRVDEEARIAFAGWITDTIEAAVEAKATELSEAAGYAGPVDAATLHARIKELLDTLGQLFRWVAEALPVVSAAYAAAEHPDQLAALAQAVDQYRARPVGPPPDPALEDGQDRANYTDDQDREGYAVDQVADTLEVLA